MIEIYLMCAAGFAGFSQGNSLGGQGRIFSLLTMLAIGWVGPLDGIHLFNVETGSVMFMAVCGWWMVAGGHTKWHDLIYSTLRYSAPAVAGAIVGCLGTQRPEFLLYALTGPIIALIFHYIGEHKPVWLINRVGNYDVARPMACAVAAWMVFL